MYHFQRRQLRQRHARPSSGLTHLNRENVLTKEVLVQADVFVEHQHGLVTDVALDHGEHVVSQQRDEDSAGHVVRVSAGVNVGLLLGELAVLLQPGHSHVT